MLPRNCTSDVGVLQIFWRPPKMVAFPVVPLVLGFPKTKQRTNKGHRAKDEPPARSLWAHEKPRRRRYVMDRYVEKELHTAQSEKVQGVVQARSAVVGWGAFLEPEPCLMVWSAPHKSLAFGLEISLVEARTRGSNPNPNPNQRDPTHQLSVA